LITIEPIDFYTYNTSCYYCLKYKIYKQLYNNLLLAMSLKKFKKEFHSRTKDYYFEDGGIYKEGWTGNNKELTVRYSGGDYVVGGYTVSGVEKAVDKAFELL
jgi:hypothetical protein